MFKKFNENDKAVRSAKYGTSFFGEILQCSKSDLFEMLGEPTIHKDFDALTRTFNEWVLASNEEGYIITVYDYWDEENVSYNDYEIIDWHIGARNRHIAEKGLSMLRQMLNDMYEPLEEINTRIREAEFEEY